MAKSSILIWVLLLSAFPLPALALEALAACVAWAVYGCIAAVSWMFVLISLTSVVFEISI